MTVARLDSIMASTKPLVTFVMDDDELKQLDDFRFANRFPSRGAAVRWLIAEALKAHRTPPDQTPRPARRAKSRA